MFDYALINKILDEHDRVRLMKRMLQSKLLAFSDEELGGVQARNIGEFLVELDVRQAELRRRFKEAIHEGNHNDS